MKKFSVFLAAIAIVLAFGLAFTACGGDSGGGPSLTAITLLNQNNVPTTSFSRNDAIFFRMIGTSPDKTITRVGIAFKKGGPTLYTDIRTISNENVNMSSPSLETWGRAGSWSPGSMGAAAGSYTIEVWFEDAKGKRSNTISQPFTVN